jgi:hypothetical protein
MALHFVGFRGDEYTTAVRIFGLPDFIHRNWDVRVLFGGELDPTVDVLVFARGDENDTPNKFPFNDSECF